MVSEGGFPFSIILEVLVYTRSFLVYKAQPDTTRYSKLYFDH
jgi:hypothetical protein